MHSHTPLHNGPGNSHPGLTRGRAGTPHPPTPRSRHRESVRDLDARGLPDRDEEDGAELVLSNVAVLLHLFTG